MAGNISHRTREPTGNESFFEAAEYLGASPVPAVVLEVATERIVAASPSGALLMDPHGGSVIGHNFEEFTTDGPCGALELFAAGRVTSYEARRQLRRPDDDSLSVNVWLHKFDHQAQSRFALAVLSELGPISDLDSVPTEGMPIVVGITGPTSVIERISNDTVELFGRPAASLVGRPMADIVVQNDRGDLVAAVAASAERNSAVTLHVEAPKSSSSQSSESPDVYQLVILPMHPHPSCAFVFRKFRHALGSLSSEQRALSNLFLRLREASQPGGPSDRLHGVADTNVPGLEELTPREWEIVAHLLDGDRVPSIAASLFLTQSTVRSHLSLVFAKLNVMSQQELLDLLRGKRGHEL